MENSQLKDLQEEVSEATKQYILTTFNSENGMKTYYLGSVRKPCGYVMLIRASELSLRKIKKITIQ